MGSSASRAVGDLRETVAADCPALFKRTDYRAEHDRLNDAPIHFQEILVVRLFALATHLGYILLHFA